MNCYEALINIAQNQYEKIYIDLSNKTAKVGRQVIIDCGIVTRNKIIVGSDVYEFDDLISETQDINKLYHQYKYSMPSERDNGRHYFKALGVNQLTDAQLVVGMPRLEARIRLEAYILLASMSGMFKWADDSKWYWKGNDKDFIILKQYI